MRETSSFSRPSFTDTGQASVCSLTEERDSKHSSSYSGFTCKKEGKKKKKKNTKCIPLGFESAIYGYRINVAFFDHSYWKLSVVYVVVLTSAAR